jgi:putative YjhG/YagF family dehydratase
MGLTVTHAALAPSGQPIWLDVATRTARAVHDQWTHKRTLETVVTDAAIENAMLVHAAFGGSTNLIIHIPAIAHAAGLPRPTVEDWRRVNRAVPRLVDALPNGPEGHPTVRAYLAGGVPEVMLELRRLGLLTTSARTITGQTLDEALDEWQESERRTVLRARLQALDGVDAADVICPPKRAREKQMTSTLAFPGGNLAPGGSVVKSTAIKPSALDADGVYRLAGRARVFGRERDAIAAIKQRTIEPGDVLVLAGRGPMGTGMEETYQLTSALKVLPFADQVALITDARFSGVSTGPCIGPVSPEALDGGPLGRLRDGDPIGIVIDPGTGAGTIDYTGDDDLTTRPLNPLVAPDPSLPADTALWARLQAASGGLWGGCVHDHDTLIELIDRARA